MSADATPTPDDDSPDSPDARQGFFGRLRSRIGLGAKSSLGALFRSRKIDAAILEELETRLLTADVGVTATEEILEALRKRVARRELSDVDALVAALRASIVEILAPCAKPLVIDTAQRPYVVLVV